MAVLSARRLSVRAAASGPPLVDDVSISLSHGSSLTILGASGSGKSVLAEALTGLLAPGLKRDGYVSVDGVEIPNDRGAARALWGHKIFLVPQEPERALDPTARVGRQTSEIFRHVLGFSRVRAQKAGEAALQAAGVPTAVRRFPCELSGGMNQRSLLAMATAVPAPILLFDEPTKGLDPLNRDRVVTQLRAFMAAGRSVLVVTHDLAVAAALGGTVALMQNARIVETGRTDTFLAHPQSPYGRLFLRAAPDHWGWSPSPGANGRTPVVSARDLGHRFGTAPALFRDLNLSIAPGEIVGLSGPSGSGKSTLGDLLVGLQTPMSGTVQRAVPGRARYLKLYQDPGSAFMPRQTFGDALSDIAGRAGAKPMKPLLQRMELGAAVLRRRPHEVSGGEAQRLAMVRALMSNPALIVADEPTSRLDPISQRETMRLLKETAQENQFGVLLISHDQPLLTAVCHSIIPLQTEDAAP